MSISFHCTACGKKVKAKGKYAGRDVRCPGCGVEITVPGLPAEAQPGGGAAPAPLPAADDPPAVVFKRALLWDDGLDMTPMIDVTFLLLIFFTITAAFALQKSMRFPNPEIDEVAEASQSQKQDEEEEDDWVEVRIDDESRIWVDDVDEASSSHQLLQRLRDKITGSGTDATGMKWLSVNASGESRFEQLVMVVDMGTEAGMEKIKIQLQEDE